MGQLNKWYEKYNAVRNKLETSNKNLEGYKSQNKDLAHRLEQVQFWFSSRTGLSGLGLWHARIDFVSTRSHFF
ncbi:14455_t:CDS:2 [Funneliformis caledonium]|uniref:14455_t:CDS:1 n=1 Tax=Funneliformis caledonium TaxID=1117310 RepID=A0A9N9G5Q8_9GLOM|nr:14455_t:CDS:2 [Funneliformis caledonium]